MIAGRESVFIDEIGSSFPKRHTPDFALRMHFVVGRSSNDRIICPRWRSTSGGEPVYCIEIFERERIAAHVGAVRKAPDAKVIIVHYAIKEEAAVAAHRVIAIEIVGRFAQQRQRVKV